MKKILLSLALFFSFSGLCFAGFSDVSGYKWAKSIEYLETLGVVHGYEDGSFKPNKTVNRAEFVKMAVGGGIEFVLPEDAYDCFSDVKETDWFAPYVCYAKDQGIVDGHPDGSFRPADTITQPEALKIVFNTWQEEVEDIGGEWWEQYLAWAELVGMYYFEPENSPQSYLPTRGEIAYFTAWELTQGYGEDQLESFDYWEDPVNEESFLWGPSVSVDGEVILATYAVNGDEIELLETNRDADPSLFTLQIDTEKHEEIWDLFTKLIPLSEREILKRFVIYTDGLGGNTVAFTTPSPNDYPEYDDWELHVDMQDSHPYGVLDKDYLIETIVHEFAHILTLNSGEIDPFYPITWREWDDSVTKCAPNLFLEEGCTREDSYINAFYREFWADIYGEFIETGILGQYVGYYSAGDGFYKKYADRFVSEYASSNVPEDMAETFMKFVLEDQPDGLDESGERSVAEDKMLFYWGYPELVELREYIKAGIEE